jgi:hypothetical protein
MSKIDRRNFIMSTLAASAAAGLSACSKEDQASPNGWTVTGSPSVMNLTVPAMDRVRVGLIGVGERGSGFVTRFCNIDGVDIVAICDTHQLVLDRAQSII